MSGFDHQFRTDQFNAQNRQFYDQQRMASGREMNQTIGQLPGMMQQAQSNKQIMELRGVEAEMQKVRLDSDMRAQEVATEAQFQKNKMIEMQMIDQLDMSRIGVESAQLGLEQQKMQLEDAKRVQKNAGATQAHKHRMELLKALGGPAFARATGQIFTVNPDGSMSFRDPQTPEELEAFAKSLDKTQLTSERRLTADGARRMAGAIAKHFEDGLGGYDWSQPGGEEAKRRYEQLMNMAQSHYLGGQGQPGPSLGGQGQPGIMPPGVSAQPGAGVPPPAQAGPQGQFEDFLGTALGPDGSLNHPIRGLTRPEPYSPPPSDASAPSDLADASAPSESVNAGPLQQPQMTQVEGEMAARAAQMMQQNASSGLSALLKDAPEAERREITAIIGKAAADLVENGRTTPDRAVGLVMDRFEQGGQDLAFLLMASDYGFDQIRAVLSTKPNHSAERVDGIMQWLTEYAQSRASKPGMDRIQQGMGQREALRAQQTNSPAAPSESGYDYQSDINQTEALRQQPEPSSPLAQPSYDYESDIAGLSEGMADMQTLAGEQSDLLDAIKELGAQSGYDYESDIAEAAGLVSKMKGDEKKRRQGPIQRSMEHREALRAQQELDAVLSNIKEWSDQQPAAQKMNRDVQRAIDHSTKVKEKMAIIEEENEARQEFEKLEKERRDLERKTAEEGEAASKLNKATLRGLKAQEAKLIELIEGLKKVKSDKQAEIDLSTKKENERKAQKAAKQEHSKLSAELEELKRLKRSRNQR